MKAKIAEIFESIQGEGVYAGVRQLFVRFYGCNLNCKYCDTSLSSFREYEAGDLLDALKAYEGTYHSVSFTGGEPLLQAQPLQEIMRLTGRHGFRNYLETNGTLPEALAKVIDYTDIISMDLKLPGSTGEKAFWGEHAEFIRAARDKELFLKAVICESTTEKDILDTVNFLKALSLKPPLVLQPDSSVEFGALAQKIRGMEELCRKENISVRVTPQLHKAIGVK